MSEADLLDLFIDALLQDPNASPPIGLRPEMAAFARDLVHAKQSAPPAASIKQRIWQQALETATPPPLSYSRNGHHAERLIKEETEMLYSVNLPQQKNVSLLWVLPAAAVLTILLGAFVLFGQLPNGDEGGNDLSSLPAGSRADSDPTEIPVITMTPTPFEPTSVPAVPTTIQAVPSDGSVTIQVPTIVPDSFILTSPDASAGGMTVYNTSPVPMTPDLNASFTIQALPAESFLTTSLIDAEPITIGQAIEGTSQGEAFTQYSFAASAGSILRVVVESDLPLGLGVYTVDLPSLGSQSATQVGTGRLNAPMDSHDLIIELSTNAQIVLSLEGAADIDAAYRVEVQSIEALPLPLDTPVESSLTPGILTPTLFEITAQAGEILNFRLQGPEDADLIMHIVDPTKDAILASDDDGGAGYLPEIMHFQVPTSGLYRVRVLMKHRDNTAEIPFTLQAERASVPLNRGESTAFIVSFKQPAAAGHLDATAGETLRLTIEPSLLEATFYNTGSHINELSSYTLNVLQNGQQIGVVVLSATETLNAEFPISQDGEVILSVNGQHGSGTVATFAVTVD